MKPSRSRGRALLVASIGVATVNYVLVGCGKSPTDPPPPPVGNPADPVPVSGNLPAPIPIPVDAAPPEPLVAVDAGKADAGKADAGKPVAKTPPKPKPQLPPTSGNLMSPD